MAGDWIKMRMDLISHPKVVRIMSAMRPHDVGTITDKFRVIGGLHAVWCVFDLHSSDGCLHGYTPEALDHIIGWPGFADALISVSWLLFDGCETIAMPEFDAHNGKSAKRRAEDTKQKNERRKAAKSLGDVRNMSADDADKMPTREEKRREEDIKEKIPSVSKKKSKIDPDMILPDAWKADAELYWSTNKRLDLIAEEQFFKFKNYHSAKGSLMLDWSAAWRTWYANATGFQNARASPSKSNIFDLTNQNYASGDL